MRIQLFLLVAICIYVSETRKHSKHGQKFGKFNRKVDKLEHGHGKGHHKNSKKFVSQTMGKNLMVDKDTWLRSPHLKYKEGKCSVQCADHEICVQDFKANKAVCVGKHFLKEGRQLVRKFSRDGQRKDKLDHHGSHDDSHGFRKNIRLPKPYDAKDGDSSFIEKPQDVEIHFRAKHKESMEQTKSIVESLDGERNVTNAAIDCRPEDMLEMRKRLTGWYALLHTQTREKKHWFKKRGQHRDHRMRAGAKQFREHQILSGHVLRKHHETHGSCDCLKSVMWEMRHLDQNLDHHLDHTELKQVERNSKEPCIFSFLKSCDANLDSRLSKHEWCCCFSDVVPPCYKEVRKLKVEDHADTDAFVPRCDSDGYFQRTQCQKSTGYCWCVDLNGNEIVESRTKEHPHCGKFDSLGHKKTL